MTEFNPTFNGGGLNKPQSKPEDKSNSGKSKVEEKEIKESVLEKKEVKL